jgi:4-hydroxy-3-polyprenylbenzoate decarboxylase
LLIKLVGMEPLFLNFLRNTLGIKGVKRVSMHEPLTNIRKVIALVCERDMPATEVWRALYGAAVLHRAAGKYVIAVNDDIDPKNADALLWAMSYRANPTLDMHVLPHRDQGHGPRSLRNGGQDASVLIDATLKENFPPVSLPKREYMENAKAIWEELGLPKLKPETPWFGYSLGEWSADFDEAAARATAGDYFETGALLEKRRRKDLAMNTEVRRVKESAAASPRAKPSTRSSPRKRRPSKRGKR